MDANIVTAFEQKILQQPEVFFAPSDIVAQDIKVFTKHIFDYCTKYISTSSVTPLDELYIDEFDADQIWGQLQLQNEPLLKELTQRMKGLKKQHQIKNLYFLPKTLETSSIQKNISESETDDISNDGNRSEEEISNGVQDINSDDVVEQIQNDKEIGNKTKKRKKKSVRDIAEDGFFNWDDMDKAAEEDENDRMSEEDEDIENEEDENEEEDFFGDSEIDDDEDEYNVNIMQDNETGDGIHHKDFFEGEDEEQDESESSEGPEGTDESDVNDENASDKDEIPRSNKEEVVEDIDDDEMAERGILSTHQKRQIEIAKEISKLEEEAIGEKQWDLRGEIRSGSRPENSLLSAVLEYDRPVKVAPVITVEVSIALEDMIKKRILDEQYDDVVRKLAPNDLNIKNPLAEVSMEKSKEGLGEIYEKAYMEQSMGYVADDSSKKEQMEIDSLFQKLCWKLDALSNFQFTPKPVTVDLAVTTPSVPAIMMEDVVPMSVSDANLLAPEEVYTKKRKRGEGAVLQSKEEMTQQERKAQRNAKKKARRKATRERVANEKLVAKMNPGLGNKYAKEKLLRDISEAKNVTKGKDMEGSSKQFSASKQFFAKLQDQVQQDITRSKTSSKSISGVAG